jgi:hypothetical protein
MARGLSAVVVAAVVALGGGAARTDGALDLNAKTEAPTLGLLRGFPSSALVRVDPELRALPAARLNVGSNTFAWSFSRDRSRLALGGDRANGYVPEVLFVDARQLRARGRVKLADTGWVVATAWLGGKLRAVVTTTGVTIVTVDPARRKVVASRRMDYPLLHVAYGRNSLVLLLGAREKIGPARLVAVRPSGAVDEVVLRRLRAGFERVTDGASRAEFRRNEPALALDPAGNRAFVVPASGEVAQVDLARLRVSYHGLSQRISLLGRLARWLEPGAQAKSIEGPARHARWLGSGLIAVSGADHSVDGERLLFSPAGVRIVDTRDWSVRQLAPGADGFRLAGEVLLLFSATWSSELTMPPPIGVAAYGLDGRKRFHLYEGTRAWVVHADERRAYIDPSGPGAVDVVDVATGRIVEQRPSVPWPLAGRAEPAID